MKLTEKLLAIGDVPTTEGEALTPDEWQALQQAAAALGAAEKALEAAELVCGRGRAPTFRQKHDARGLIPAALTLIRGDAK